MPGLAQSPQINPRPLDLQEEDTTGRSVLIGIGCTLVFHLLLVLLAPQFAFQGFSGVHSGISVSNANKGKTFDFELAQPAIPPEEKHLLKFMETNSAAPENAPDKTDYFSSRDQQSAQEVAALEKDPENRPSVKGQDEIKNDSAIVTGDRAQPQIASAPMLESDKEEARDQAAQQARAEEVPLSGFEKSEGASEDGIAMNIAKSKSPTTHADQAVDGAHDGASPEGGLIALPQLSKALPKERPRLSSVSTNRSTPLTNRAVGTSRIGVQASNAFKSEYGEYLQQLIEIVDIQWNRILRESQISPPRGSHVTITFKINSLGETDIIKVEDAGSGKQGVWSCQSAITEPSPYRKWTDQMIAVLGNEQTLDFSFFYSH